jgi:NAD(P)H-dependent FMN reductase
LALKLATLICSTRPGRIGPAIAEWFHGIALQSQFEATLVDLKELNLPIFDEPHHPRLKKYEHAHTKAWSAIVDGADAFAFVTPEYNHCAPVALVNAVTYLHQEWQYKPAMFVSYGGPAGGARGVNASKLLLSPMKVVSLFESVLITMVAAQMKEGKFTANDGQATAANLALSELHRWAEALKPMRAK